MKKIIKGKVYDTDKAKKIGEWDNGHYTSDFNFCAETLFRKKNGEYFLFGEGHALSKYASHSSNNSWWGEKIISLTYAEAQAWAEDHLDGDEYIEIFGDPENQHGRGVLSLSLPAATIAKARQEAAKKGLSLSDYFTALIG